MMIARWTITAKFGYKQSLIDTMKQWVKEIGPQAGLRTDGMRLVTGSVGALESEVQLEYTVKDLAELNQAWEKLATIPAHAQWGKDMEPLVVSGTNRWEIYRVLS